MSIRHNGIILAGNHTSTTGQVVQGDMRPVSGDTVKRALDSLSPGGAGASTIVSDTTPTSSTVGALGQFYKDTVTGKLYICSGIDDSGAETEYTWEEHIPMSYKGAANGVAELDGNGLVPSSELPVAGNTLGAVKVGASGGLSVPANAYLRLNAAQAYAIDPRVDNNNGYGAIVPSNLDYAVRSVLPNVTVIPAATSEYSLLDSSATTNSHSWVYEHAPEAAPTYTLPDVTNESVLHTIILTVDFTSVQTCSFEDSEGTIIAPLDSLDITAGDVVEYLCRYDNLQEKWVISASILN